MKSVVVGDSSDCKQPGRKSILVLGATGYLGQFIVQELAKYNKVGIVYHSTAAPSIQGAEVHQFWVDLSTGEGLQEAFETLGPVQVVINCAAISSPAACEKQPERSKAINVPTKLLDSLDIHRLSYDSDPLLIHFSSDQVYNGSKAYWKEDDSCDAINNYGRTKREAETLIQERWPHHIILRSSIIFGPQSPVPVSRPLFLQFIQRSLASGKPANFFLDEFRSPIYARDIVSVVSQIISRKQLPERRLFNLGGPERLSRVDMAHIVAKTWGYSPAGIQAVPASSVQRDVASPADISMDSANIRNEFPDVVFHTFSQALCQIRPEEQATE